MGSAECDPIVQAGALRCWKCLRVAFPTDAMRLNSALIVAVFPAPCEHVGAETLVIEMDDRAVVAADPALSLYVPGRHCAGRNRKGRPCGSYARPGSEYCRAHPAVTSAGKPT